MASGSVEHSHAFVVYVELLLIEVAVRGKDVAVFLLDFSVGVLNKGVDGGLLRNDEGGFGCSNRVGGGIVSWRCAQLSKDFAFRPVFCLPIEGKQTFGVVALVG